MEIQEPFHEWGGPWTEKKLEAFEKYVKAYLTIMNKYPYWKTIYFDGFAGSGSKGIKKNEFVKQLPILPQEEQVYKGSAERVIKIKDNLGFDYYYFIDRNASSLNKLRAHLKAIPEANNKIIAFREGDANRYLLELSDALKKKKTSYAALVFLDPFGMQINWDSIASLKDTRSDIWILIPTGVIVNRLLDKKGELHNIQKLEQFFGLNENEIRSHFYRTNIRQTLFGEAEVTAKVLQPIEKIAALYIDRLKEIWKHVTLQPLRLDNTRGVPIYHFVFASNNKNAVKIANQIIEKTK